MSSNYRIQLAHDTEEANIRILATEKDVDLVQKIDLIDLQSEIAIQKKMDESLELLEIWRAQIIAARIYKAENNIPDAPNEIELAIADIETTVAKAEEREDALGGEYVNQRPRQRIREDNSDQMSLF